MHMSEQTSEIFAAIAAAQGKLDPAAKDSVNPHFKSRYADLAAVVEASREVLAAHGLGVIQEPITNIGEGYVGVRTMLTHKSGQWITLEPLWAKPARGLGPQDVGATITYLRRYSRSPAIGLTTDDDDDGETASGRGKAPTPKPAAKPENPRYKERTAAPKAPDPAAMKRDDRQANLLAAFKTLGWTAAHVEEAIGMDLDQFGDGEFKLAKEIYNTERERRSKAGQARAQFED